MRTTVTARVDSTIKERATKIMKRHGVTPSAAVQQLFDYVVKYDRMPFSDQSKPSHDEILARVRYFDNCRASKPATFSDGDIRDARLKARYGSLS